ncbi:MAG: UDP-N-acetylglucosamine 1-carboxyvinyltransferase [Candidatus Levybacteria bacterium]|nr:UDP-N-acetylglucosamine 1-carboxyvinyltransferase [Candidatus Levybacteria bacterium]
MDKFIVHGGRPLRGEVSVSGAKNVSLKALVAACLTTEEVIIENIPHISDFFVMVDTIKHLGGKVTMKDHSVSIHIPEFSRTKISLEKAAEIRTSSMFLAPLLARAKKAIIPNPGGCRIGARPIDRVVAGLEKMGAEITYKSEDGYFHAKTTHLHGATYRFEKNTHTGTETLILAAVLADGRTVLENAAEEPEVDELIELLCSMGAKIKRSKPRTIVIEGVERLHGTTFRIGPDRNEIVTLAVASAMTNGDITIKEANKAHLKAFLETYKKAGGSYEEKGDAIRFFVSDSLLATDIETAAFPGFMTDWQGPWTVLMTKAKGVSIIHETVYENRFNYVKELIKMGAHIELFNPEVKHPETVYNFNTEDDRKDYFHAARVVGGTALHNAVVTISDLRAGATLVLASLSASGETVIFGVEHLDRGYEHFEERLRQLGARIKRITE